MAALLPPPPLPLFPSTTVPTTSSSPVCRLSFIPNSSRGNNLSIQTSPPPKQQPQQKAPPPTTPSSTTSKGKKPHSTHPAKSANKHPAFRPLKEKGLRSHKVPLSSSSSPLPEGISVGNNGLSYRLDGAPFEFQYSYTETPKAKPVALRETPYLPFGPATMPRPWTGKAPLPKSRRKIPEFDSFKPPPPGKKGVKAVQPPGPFLPGTGPRYVASREEILGDPLTQEEVKDLLKSCLRAKRQLNIGRDGLTHNMLDNIHAHWKRRRVCKIKCKGVCTVDMDNVRQQLEDKTGGKVIYSRGGVMFLFRGRNYNYKTRPRFPLMLWKPASPVYPKLVRRVPDGLTLEEVTGMRRKGRTLPPICKLGKNGVYSNLVQNVKEAFEVCELARVNCTGLNKSDVRKIGAKLKDLVPCVLISFEFEHILMWRGKDWESSLVLPEDHINQPKLVTGIPLPPEASGAIQQASVELDTEIDLCEDGSCTKSKDGGFNSCGEESDDCLRMTPYVSDHGKGDAIDRVDKFLNGKKGCNDDSKLSDDASITLARGYSALERNGCLEISGDLPVSEKNSSAPESSSTGISFGNDHITAISTSKHGQCSGDPEAMTGPVCVQIESRRGQCMNGVASLLKQATEIGFAITLDDSLLNDDIIYERAVDLARSAPRGPIFRHKTRKSARRRKIKPAKAEKDDDLDQDIPPAPKEATVKRARQVEASSDPKIDTEDSFPDVAPLGSLKVDELANLLA